MRSTPSLGLAAACSLFLQTVNATPVLNQPTRVFARDSPSSYPLGDSCGGEWQYLNFDPSDATDMGRLQQLHQVVCGDDLNMLLLEAVDAVQNANAVYTRYFPNDEDNNNILSVYQLLLNPSDPGGLAPLIESFIVDNNDFDDVCVNADGESENLAYTDDDTDDLEKIHFCDVAYSRPSLLDVQCSSLDPYPSTKFDTLARIALHEMTHYSTVGPASGVALQIVDVKNKDKYFAYDPDRAHGLNDPNQDGYSDRVDINADSYAWMASDAFFSFACTTTPDNYAAYFEDPPAYVPEANSDDGDDNNESGDDSDNPNSDTDSDE